MDVRRRRGPFSVTKQDLERQWSALMYMANYTSSDQVEYFYHCTKLKYKWNICRLSRLEATYTDLPGSAPLATNPDLQGVWFGICFYGGKLPSKSPYGCHMIQIPVADMMNLMETDTPLPDTESEESDTETDEDSLADYDGGSDADSKDTNREATADKEVDSMTTRSVSTMSTQTASSSGHNHDTPVGRKDMNGTLNTESLPENKTVNMKRFKEPGIENESTPLKDVNGQTGSSICDVNLGFTKLVSKRDVKPLLYFECAHSYNKSQYVRLVLIRSDDPHVGWCEDHLKRVNLYDNPFCRWHPESACMYTIHNDNAWHRVHVEVKVIGDVTFEDFDESPKWTKIGKAQRASGNPKIGVRIGH